MQIARNDFFDWRINKVIFSEPRLVFGEGDGQTWVDPIGQASGEGPGTEMPVPPDDKDEEKPVEGPAAEEAAAEEGSGGGADNTVEVTEEDIETEKKSESDQILDIYHTSHLTIGRDVLHLTRKKVVEGKIDEFTKRDAHKDLDENLDKIYERYNLKREALGRNIQKLWHGAGNACIREYRVLVAREKKAEDLVTELKTKREHNKEHSSKLEARVRAINGWKHPILKTQAFKESKREWVNIRLKFDGKERRKKGAYYDELVAKAQTDVTKIGQEAGRRATEIFKRLNKKFEPDELDRDAIVTQIYGANPTESDKEELNKMITAWISKEEDWHKESERQTKAEQLETLIQEKIDNPKARKNVLFLLKRIRPKFRKKSKSATFFETLDSVKEMQKTRQEEQEKKAKQRKANKMLEEAMWKPERLKQLTTDSKIGLTFTSRSKGRLNIGRDWQVANLEKNKERITLKHKKMKLVLERKGHRDWKITEEGKSESLLEHLESVRF